MDSINHELRNLEMINLELINRDSIKQELINWAFSLAESGEGSSTQEIWT